MTILIFIAVLLLLIIGHEFGHFIAAKRAGMRVDEFGIGFPPKAFGRRFGNGETEYSVNWLPFGGFVKIFGEDAENSTAADPRAFSNKPAVAQAAVLFAGPFMNVVLAFVLSAAAFTVGTVAVIDETNAQYLSDEPRTLVGGVLSESPAEAAGVRAGDEIRAVSNGTDTFVNIHPEELARRISEAPGAVVLTLVRDGETLQTEATPVPGLVADEPERRAIGIATALVGGVTYPPHVALWKGLEDTAGDFVFVLGALGALVADSVTFSADVSNLAGPVGIATLTGEAASFGLGSLLSFAALLSINLAIINLLPFPALDGGRLLFLGIETVSRRRIPSGVAQAVNAGGFAVLILLMIVVTVGDVARLLG
ncbi:MAG: RIP metalloprotease [Candidatus Paceibacteria bacterium]